MSFIVAIDGPAGTGKGTVAKKLSEDLKMINIDTGAMFRCVAFECIRNSITINEIERIKEILEKINIEIKHIDGEQKIFLNNEDVSSRIREKDITDFVSPISTIKEVRHKLLMMQREYANENNIIMEGRDIGTAVFPNANVKIYLDATAEERAKRRMKQNKEAGIETTFEEALNNINDRDKRDSSREIAPLRKADDAILVDSTNLSINEVVDKIEQIIFSRGFKKKE